jgi:hypothetical protein
MIIGPGINIGNGITLSNDINTLVMNLLMNNPSSWPGSGSTIYDLSGYGNNATLQSYTTYTSNSVSSVRGSNSGAITTNYNLPASNWTVRIIANIASNSSFWATLWGNEIYNSSQGFFAYQGSSTGMTFGIPGGTTAIASGITQGTTKQYDFTYNGATFTMYVNGVSVATALAAPPTASNDGLYFGSRHTNTGGATNTDYMSATFYMMQVYSAVQNSSAISAAYTANKTTYGI